MQTHTSPENVIQRQLDAYNAKDVDAWLATYAPDAKQYEHPAKLVASGHAEIRARTAVRLSEPNIHAQLLSRSVMGKVVIDHEIVTRNFPEGIGKLELVCMYVVENGLIQSVSFVAGTPILES